ncbi:MAG: hypothetical protein M1426_00005, partial [Patescibacteria group bacterium]|nr:hypothetical protein [Patescibacteria group bacterium]
MSDINRRAMLRIGAAMTAGIAAAPLLKNRTLEATPLETSDCVCEQECAPGHTLLFMDEYHQGTMEILNQLKGELDHVGDLTSRAAKVIKTGGTVWTSMSMGHMPGAEMDEKRRGNPGLMKSHKEFDALKKGDMVFTNQCNKAVQAARDRGVYVVCVTVNYIDNEFRPRGFTNPNEDNLMLKDVSNEILHSHIPYYQGLVHAPEIPEISICPSTTTGSGTLHWMLNAELANKLANTTAFQSPS